MKGSNRYCTVLAIAALMLLSSCATLGTILPGGPTMADAAWSGVKTQEPRRITSMLDPRVDAVIGLIHSSGHTVKDPIGVLLALTLIGSTEVRWVECTGEYAQKCVDFPLNARVDFVGSFDGVFWDPSMLTAQNFDD